MTAALAHLRQASTGLQLRTHRADLAGWRPGEAADTVLLVDVLYQLATGPQTALLDRAAAGARQTVIIRASDPASGWRSTLSAGLERIGRAWWPTFGARYNALPPAQLAKALAGCGFEVTTVPCAKGTPLAGVLLVGRRPLP